MYIPKDDLKFYKCKVCGKTFRVDEPKKWVYRKYRGKTRTTQLVCSWKCVCESKKKIYKANDPRIPERQRKVDFIMKHYKDMTMKEMSKALGCGYNTVGTICRDYHIKAKKPELSGGAANHRDRKKRRKDLIMTEYKSIISVSELSKLLGSGDQTTKKYLTELGIEFEADVIRR